MHLKHLSHLVLAFSVDLTSSSLVNLDAIAHKIITSRTLDTYLKSTSEAACYCAHKYHHTLLSLHR